MSKFHSDVKFLQSIKEAAEQAEDAVRALEDIEGDIEFVQSNIEDADEYRGVFTTAEVEQWRIDLLELQVSLEAAKEDQKRAFSWFTSVSGIGLD